MQQISLLENGGNFVKMPTLQACASNKLCWLVKIVRNKVVLDIIAIFPLVSAIFIDHSGPLSFQLVQIPDVSQCLILELDSDGLVNATWVLSTAKYILNNGSMYHIICSRKTPAAGLLRDQIVKQTCSLKSS